MSKLDTKRLRELFAEMESLIGKKRWNEAAFNRLMDSAIEVSGGHGDAVTFLLKEARPDWVERRRNMANSAVATGIVRATPKRAAAAARR